MLWCGLAVAAVLLLAGCHKTGLDFVVDTTADTVDVTPGDGVCEDASGDCSLRAAVMESNAAPGVDSITLAAGTTYTLTRAGTGEDAATTGDLDFTEGVDISGGSGTVIDADGLDRVVDVHLTGSDGVYLAHVDLTGGSAADGAAIRGGSAGQHWLNDVEIAGNTATGGAPVSVGGSSAIWASVTVADNSGSVAGGLQLSGGSLTTVNVTFSGNTSASGAGALAVSGGGVSLKLSTITDNTGSTAGGIERTSGTVTLLSSIVGQQASGDDCVGTVVSDGYNLESDGTCGLSGTGDLQVADLGLEALADNGGGVRTHLLQPSSSAADRFEPPCGAPVDARASGRPVGTLCDAGATETAAFVVGGSGDTVDTTPGDGVCADGTGSCTLRAAVIEANALAGEQRIVFDDTVGTVTLSIAGASEDAAATGDLDLTESVTIDGGPAGVTIDADGLDRVLHTRGDSDITLERLRLTGAYEASAPGGGLRVYGTSAAGSRVTADSLTIDGNDAFNGDGVFVDTYGTLTMTNSTVGDNSGHGIRSRGTTDISYTTVATNTGHGLHHWAGTMTVSSSVIASNGGDDCLGTPVSGGYNLVSDTSCTAFTATGDVTDTDVFLGGLNTPDGSALASFVPEDPSAVVDAIPTGSLGCGSTAVDQNEVRRPVGGDCDRGAVEVDAAYGSTFTVNHEGDAVDDDPGDGVCQDSGGGAGDCSLRAAVQESNGHYGPDLVDFDPAVRTITITIPGTLEDAGSTGDLDVTDSTTVDGGANGVTVDADSLDRSFHAISPAHLTVQRLRMTNGWEDPSGGDGGAGVKVDSFTPDDGALVTADSVTVDNGAASDGAGFLVPQGGTLEVVNSTISGNIAHGIRSWGDLDVSYTTIAGSDVALYQSDGTTTVTASVIFAAYGGSACVGTITSGGYNVANDTTCGLAGTGDQEDTDPELGALNGPVGSESLSFLPAAGSPVVDAVPSGSAGCGSTVADDQHGTARPTGGDCDAGAVEYQSGLGSTFTVNHGGDAVDDDPGDGVCQDNGGSAGDCSLRAAVQESNSHQGLDSIDFDAAVSTVTLSVAGTGEEAAATGDLDLVDSVEIDGGATGTTVDADTVDRVFHAQVFADVTLRRLRVTNGYESTNAGGGLRLEGNGATAATAVLDSVTVDGNDANQGDGVWVHANGSLDVTNSTISGNNGHGIRSWGTTVIAYSTLYGNASRGVIQSGSGTVTISGSVLDSNGVGDCANTITSGGYNLAGDATCTGFVSTGDQQNASLLLGSLADNGGPTLTHLPGGSSAALDVIPNGTIGCGGTVAVDQRAVTRPQNASCDSGAVEVVPAPL